MWLGSRCVSFLMLIWLWNWIQKCHEASILNLSWHILPSNNAMENLLLASLITVTAKGASWHQPICPYWVNCHVTNRHILQGWSFKDGFNCFYECCKQSEIRYLYYVMHFFYTFYSLFLQSTKDVLRGYGLANTVCYLLGVPKKVIKDS